MQVKAHWIRRQWPFGVPSSLLLLLLSGVSDHAWCHPQSHGNFMWLTLGSISSVKSSHIRQQCPCSEFLHAIAVFNRGGCSKGERRVKIAGCAYLVKVVWALKRTLNGWGQFPSGSKLMKPCWSLWSLSPSHWSGSHFAEIGMEKLRAGLLGQETGLDYFPDSFSAWGFWSCVCVEGILVAWASFG